MICERERTSQKIRRVRVVRTVCPLKRAGAPQKEEFLPFNDIERRANEEGRQARRLPLVELELYINKIMDAALKHNRDVTSDTVVYSRR